MLFLPSEDVLVLKVLVPSLPRALSYKLDNVNTVFINICFKVSLNTLCSTVSYLAYWVNQYRSNLFRLGLCPVSGLRQPDSIHLFVYKLHCKTQTETKAFTNIM